MTAKRGRRGGEGGPTLSGTLRRKLPRSCQTMRHTAVPSRCFTIEMGAGIDDPLYFSR